MGRVESEDRDRAAAVKHDVCGVGIGEDVVLRGRRAVAGFLHGPAHQDDPGDLAQDARVPLHGGRDVGQRPGRHQGDGRVVAGEERLHDEVDGVRLSERQAGFRELDAVEPGRAVHHLGREELARQGPPAAGKDRDVDSTRDLADPPRIALRHRQRGIPGHDRDAKDVELVG